MKPKDTASWGARLRVNAKLPIGQRPGTVRQGRAKLLPDGGRHRRKRRPGASGRQPAGTREDGTPGTFSPGADGEFHLTREGWARLVREYMDYARLSPPPIEEAGEVLSADEVRLLLAAPVVKAPEEEMEEETVSSPSEEKSAIAPAPEKQAERGTLDDDEDDHIHNDEEAERAAAAARNVS